MKLYSLAFYELTPSFGLCAYSIIKEQFRFWFDDSFYLHEFKRSLFSKQIIFPSFLPTYVLFQLKCVFHHKRKIRVLIRLIIQEIFWYLQLTLWTLFDKTALTSLLVLSEKKQTENEFKEYNYCILPFIRPFSTRDICQSCKVLIFCIILEGDPVSNIHPVANRPLNS